MLMNPPEDGVFVFAEEFRQGFDPRSIVPRCLSSWARMVCAGSGCAPVGAKPRYFGASVGAYRAFKYAKSSLLKFPNTSPQPR